MKKSICLIILMSMLLHGAGRLRIISYIFEQRHDIAYALGLISEIPIAMCDRDYHADKSLTLQFNDETNAQKLPGSFLPQTEINLFFQLVPSDGVHASAISDSQKLDSYIEPGYPQPLMAIFHPPCA